jgi:E3 ubiquitin-protein ligase MYCBP2
MMSFADALRPSLELLEAVPKKALKRLRYENAEKMPELSDPASRFFNDPAGFALSRYAYYQCHKCRKPYFGGMAHCAVAGGGAFRAEDLVCGACLPHASEASCAKHGADFIQWKCRFCCSNSVFLCVRGANAPLARYRVR